MRHQYRVTKYDPALRENGAFTADEWTSYSDVGRSFGGVRLTEEEYLRVEAAYLFAVEAFLREARIDSLELRDVEDLPGGDVPLNLRSGTVLPLPDCIELARLALRERIWGKLVLPGRAYVHLGYDYYMYLGLPVPCPDAMAAVRARGLFVEPFRSPYL